MQPPWQAARMGTTWIENRHNLHCPTCDARLIERAGRHDVMQRPDPVYVSDPTTLTCPAGHRLPENQDELYEYRDSHGHQQEAPIREVPPPGQRAHE